MRLLCLTLVFASACSASDAVVDTVSQPVRSGAVVWLDSGAVRGVVKPSTIEWNGIPYAAPPLGPLRWQAPQPVTPWSDVRDGSAPRAACEQSDAGTMPVSEDCLYLNVTAPLEGRHLPVMVWLHGGGFSGGAGWSYHPTRLAAEGHVIVVTVDFRLGIFGFFGHPGLADSGTFGLQDQQAALRWVRRNAAALGGDPHNVTLFGESGGAVAVCGQLTSPLAAGLFDRAIMESGSCLLDWPAGGLSLLPPIPAGSFWRSRAEVEQSGTAVAAELGCGADALTCLRQLSPEALLAKNGVFPDAAFDTPVFPQSPVEALAAGRVNRVPVLSGHNHDEARLIIALPRLVGAPPLDEAAYQTLLVQAFGDRAAEVAVEYPAAAYLSPTLAWAAMDTDRVFACPQLATAEALAQHMPVHAYEFADPDAPPFITVAFPPDLPPGASHGAELVYLFEVDGLPPVPLTPAQQGLAAQMVQAWTRFARTGRPGWPRWGQVQALAPGAIASVDDQGEHHCAFWRSF